MPHGQNVLLIRRGKQHGNGRKLKYAEKPDDTGWSDTLRGALALHLFLGTVVRQTIPGAVFFGVHVSR